MSVQITSDYGTRICLACQGSYTATFAAQITCSKTCADERRRHLRALASKRYRSKKGAELHELREQILALEARLQASEDLKARLRAARDRLAELESRLRAVGKNATREEELNRRIREMEEEVQEKQQLEDKLQEALDRNRELFVEVAHLKARIAVLQSQTEGSAPGADVHPVGPALSAVGKAMLECRRMNLRATTLPCGQRDECRYPSPCEQMAKTDPGNRICPQCQKEFKPSHHKQKYCSGTCADAARKDRVRKT